MYDTCGQSCCVEHVCDLNGTRKWNVLEKDLTEWKNYIQQDILERTLSDEHWTQMVMKNIASVKATSVDGHEMNIVSGCPRIRHLVRWYLPTTLTIPRTPMICVGHLHRTAVTLRERLQWSGDCNVDSDCLCRQASLHQVVFKGTSHTLCRPDKKLVQPHSGFHSQEDTPDKDWTRLHRQSESTSPDTRPLESRQ